MMNANHAVAPTLSGPTTERAVAVSYPGGLAGQINLHFPAVTASIYGDEDLLPVRLEGRQWLEMQGPAKVLCGQSLAAPGKGRRMITVWGGQN